jgi:HEAT repeat protein
LQTKPGPNTAQANASQIHLEKYAQYVQMVVQSVIHQYNGQPVPPATLNPQSLVSSLRSLYLSQKTLSIFRIKAEQEWEFKVPIEEIYVRLGIIESKERKVRDQALDKHSDHIQDDRIPTSETIFEPKKNIEIEKLFEHESLEKKDRRRIYIQGAAGIGKSTLCHYIAYHWAKEDLWPGIFSYLFWIPLRNLTLRKYPPDKEYTPAKLIAREYEGKIDSKVIEVCVNNAAFREKTLLVLDGYDELSAEAQGNTSLATAFEELKKLFPHIIITSRPGSCSFKRSCELELLGFDKEGVDRYIDRFFKQVQAEEKKQKLHQLLQTSPYVLSLAQIPINLTLLCCLFNEDPEVFDSTHSITMTAIYERIVNWMYKWFLLRRIDQGHANQTKEKILAEKNLRHNQEVENIATAFEEMADFAMENNTLYLEKQEIDDFRGNAITSNELTDCGLLRIPEEKGYFIHLTFQEFLTASKVANQYLQGENRQACQHFVHNYKFEPRYNLVLRMIAGYLSLSTSRNRRYLNSNPLQSFFDDLFAEPYDLAVRSELHLIANCFEECQNPAQVRQYEGFIEFVKDYMIHLSELGLNVEGLLRNKNLLNHPKVTTSIERLLSNPKTLENMLSILLSILGTGQRLSLEIVRLIVKVLKDHEDHDVSRLAAATLGTVAKQGGKLPEEAIDAFIQILKKGDYITKEHAAVALGTVAKQGGEFSKEALDALVQVLNEGDYIAKEHAADALGTAAGQEGEFSEEALNALVQVLKEGDYIAKEHAAVALGTAAKQGGKLPEEAIDAFIQILKKGDSDVRRHAANALGEVAQQGGKLPKEAVDALVQVLKEGDSYATYTAAAATAADVLITVAQQGGEFSKEEIDTLVQILKEGDSYATLGAAHALRTVARQGGKLPKEAIDAFIQILKEGDSDATYGAANAPAMVAKQGSKTPKEALDTLIQILKKGDSYATLGAAHALRTVAKKQEDELSKEALDTLVQILKEGNIDATRAAVDTLKIAAEQGGEFSKEVVDALIQIFKEGDSYATLGAADALIIAAEQGGEFSKEALDALVRILKEGDSYATHKAADALGRVAGLGGEIANEVLDILIQILKGGDIATKRAVDALKKVNKNALLEMSLEAFPLIARICFYTESSFSIKSQQFQISDRRTIYSSDQSMKLNYEELKEKLPTELAVWRKQLDILSQAKIYK